ncbi:PREDICTED: ferritin heavy polypeptide-like 17 [Ceratosolen solmsi marchali]|uniref:Ferritin n=1 Tax=Ceratosolen solmsi marchali TaxID=326594 RepID=A0AAJ7DUK2_9HYME|nr:PREDICTED: ferritin heavy polypeptide-like 17 [Ceratosolen solmsi marchali]
MFVLGVLYAVLITTSAEFCYKDVENVCSQKLTSVLSDDLTLSNCNAKYGGIDSMQIELQAYANGHIETSFEFLLMSTHFGNYESNRVGFKNLYRKLSDSAWEKSIDLIKYITKRGGSMNFNQLPHFKKNEKDSHVLELTEIHSLAKALDSQKQLAAEGLRLHIQAKKYQDAAIAHYLEEKFLESQSDVVRVLAGHTSDLKNMLDRDASVAIFLFDEYLQKIL